jgi:hypothetical protein
LPVEDATGNGISVHTTTRQTQVLNAQMRDRAEALTSTQQWPALVSHSSCAMLCGPEKLAGNEPTTARGQP